jgi:hypothetical protein
MEALIVLMQQAKTRESNPVDHLTMAYLLPPRGAANHAMPRIHLGKRDTGSNVASPAAVWLQRLDRRSQVLQNETRDQSTPCRKSPRLGFHRYFSASSRNFCAASILHYHVLQNLPESYPCALNKASVSPTSNPRACKPLLSFRRAS